MTARWTRCSRFTGVERWRRAQTVHARVRGGGLLIRTRVPGNRFADSHIAVHVQEPRTVFDRFPRAGQRGVFQGRQVADRTSRREVLGSRAQARAAFFGRAGDLRRNLHWDPLDSVYFAGYAMWNDVTFPHLLTREGVEVSDGDSWPERGETWRRLDASFPPDIDTHSVRQTFYVDAGGRLRRHDYVPEVIGRWARSAPYCADHVQAGGGLFPTRRWVLQIGPGSRSLPARAAVSRRSCISRTSRRAVSCRGPR
jgi:hypothetical protein